MRDHQVKVLTHRKQLVAFLALLTSAQYLYAVSADIATDTGPQQWFFRLVFILKKAMRNWKFGSVPWQDLGAGLATQLASS